MMKQIADDLLQMWEAGAETKQNWKSGFVAHLSSHLLCCLGSHTAQVSWKGVCESGQLVVATDFRSMGWPHLALMLPPED